MDTQCHHLYRAMFFFVFCLVGAIHLLFLNVQFSPGINAVQYLFLGFVSFSGKSAWFDVAWSNDCFVDAPNMGGSCRLLGIRGWTTPHGPHGLTP